MPLILHKLGKETESMQNLLGLSLCLEYLQLFSFCPHFFVIGKEFGGGEKFGGGGTYHL